MNIQEKFPLSFFTDTNYVMKNLDLNQNYTRNLKITFKTFNITVYWNFNKTLKFSLISQYS